MPDEITTEYTAENWNEAIKDYILSTFYLIEGIAENSATLYIRDSYLDDRLSQIRKSSHDRLYEGWTKLAKM
jgi:hypothetical protein